MRQAREPGRRGGQLKKIAAYEAEQKAFAQEIDAYFPGGGKLIDNACDILG